MPPETGPAHGRTADVVRDIHDEAARDPNLAVASVRPLGTTRFELWLAARDVMRKLDVHRETSVLEIGCGVGVIGLPIARRVRRYVGVDLAEAALDVFRRRLAAAGLEGSASLVGLDFAADTADVVEPLGRFDRVLAYAVLHYVASDAAGRSFIARAIGALEPGGRALFGNLPLADLATQPRRGTPNALGFVESRQARVANRVVGGSRLLLRPLDRGARTPPRSVPPGSVAQLSRALIEGWLEQAPVPVRWQWLAPGAATPLSHGRADLLVIRDD